jgi:hypothetical protein
VVGIDNDPAAMAAVVTEAGPSPEVVIEATYGWYWVVDLLQGVRPRPSRWDESYTSDLAPPRLAAVFLHRALRSRSDASR